ADESDGSIVYYKPEIGLLLNVDKDHKEIDSLMEIFTTFKNNSKKFVVNRSHPLARKLSVDIKNDFSTDKKFSAGYAANDFRQSGLNIQFSIPIAIGINVQFSINAIGRHNMENAVAAVTVADQIGV